MSTVDIDTLEDPGFGQYSTAEAREALREFFEGHTEEVFFVRQLQVLFERRYFHWLTHRALRELEGLEIIRSEIRELRTGSIIKLLWHRSLRYYRRAAQRVVSLVEEYADPNIGGALGLQGEAMVLEGFAGLKFVMEGRDENRYKDAVWSETDHNLDFIFSRDGMAYGVEVKNTLAYIDQDEFNLKIRMCQMPGVLPVFAARMLPRTWIWELNGAGGYAMVLEYQLYPWAHRDLAKRVAKELGLPVDTPKRLAQGTMTKFLNWHMLNIR